MDDKTNSKIIRQNQYNMEKSTELQKKKVFINCINDKLIIDGYEVFNQKVEKQDFDINDKENLDFIISLCKKFESIPLDGNDGIINCIEKAEYNKITDKICNGDVSLNMIEILTYAFEFIGIHVNFKDLNINSIKVLIPYIKGSFKKVIEISEYFEQKSCNGETSKVVKNLKTIYNELFETHNIIKYPFDMNINLDWFNTFNRNIYTKLILLVFIAFIFTQMVKLFSNRGEVVQK